VSVSGYRRRQAWAAGFIPNERVAAAIWRLPVLAAE
jgi:hypothetical protein